MNCWKLKSVTVKIYRVPFLRLKTCWYICMTNETLLHVISFLWCIVVSSKNEFSPNPALSRFQFLILYMVSFSSIYEIRVMESAPFVCTVNDRGHIGETYYEALMPVIRNYFIRTEFQSPYCVVCICLHCSKDIAVNTIPVLVGKRTLAVQLN